MHSRKKTSHYKNLCYDIRVRIKIMVDIESSAYFEKQNNTQHKAYPTRVASAFQGHCSLSEIGACGEVDCMILGTTHITSCRGTSSKSTLLLC